MIISWKSNQLYKIYRIGVLKNIKGEKTTYFHIASVLRKLKNVYNKLIKSINKKCNIAIFRFLLFKVTTAFLDFGRTGRIQFWISTIQIPSTQFLFKLTLWFQRRMHARFTMPLARPGFSRWIKSRKLTPWN